MWMNILCAVLNPSKWFGRIVPGALNVKIEYASSQVAASAGPACASALREVTRRVDAELASNPLKIKSLFGVEQVRPLYIPLWTHYIFCDLTEWISCFFVKPDWMAPVHLHIHLGHILRMLNKLMLYSFTHT